MSLPEMQMNSGSCGLTYQKGDLITIKQATMICVVSGNMKRFATTKKPTNAIFLSYEAASAEDEIMFEYLRHSTPISKACKVAVGNDICFVDSKSFFFHIKDRR